MGATYLTIYKMFKKYKTPETCIKPSFKPTNSLLTTWKAISKNFINLEQHPFHMVDPSPWPFAISFSLYFLACTLNLAFNFGNSTPFDIFISLGITLFILFCWINDVITESIFFGHHTKKVLFGLISGLSYFIVSELFLFISIFWAFFHLSLTPSIFIGACWPPIGLENVETFLLPLANTLILAFSGIALTLVHGILVTDMFNPYKTLNFIKKFHKNSFISLLVLRSSKKLETFNIVKSIYFYPLYRYAIIQEFLGVTLFFALWFTYLQYVEYCGTSFAINDTALGTIFFFSTGFHGIHVIFGACMLLIQAILIKQNRVFTDQLIGFEFATIYWHFVDIVWLGLFIVIYGWVQGELILPKTLKTPENAKQEELDAKKAALEEIKLALAKEEAEAQRIATMQELHTHINKTMERVLLVEDFIKPHIDGTRKHMQSLLWQNPTYILKELRDEEVIENLRDAEIAARAEMWKAIAKSDEQEPSVENFRELSNAVDNAYEAADVLLKKLGDLVIEYNDYFWWK